MLVRIKVSSGLVPHASFSTSCSSPRKSPKVELVHPVHLLSASPQRNPYKLLTQYLQFLLFFSTFNKRFLIAVREPEGSSFARHINLQLTYSFQNNAQNPMHMNGSKAGLYPTHGKKVFHFWG